MHVEQSWRISDELNIKRQVYGGQNALTLVSPSKVSRVYLFKPPVHPEDFEVKQEQAVVETEGKYTKGSICINRYPKVGKWCDINEFKEVNICKKINFQKFWDDIIEHLHILAKKSPL